MPCYHPWHTDKGNVASCGQCRGCRSAHARGWAMRCMHEASMHADNIFLTLTSDDDHLYKRFREVRDGKLVWSGSLDGPVPFRVDGPPAKPGAFALFMKRLRKEIGKVRYYHVGEYGEASGRPHYHALLFGWSPSDKEVLSVRQGFPVFTSEILRKAWPDGLSEFGSVTAQSAAYCTGYVKTRMTGSWAKARYGNREVPYGTMSRNPGIGASWLDRYGRCDVYPADSVVVRGTMVKPPRYYDLRMGAMEPELMDGVKLCRFSRRRRENETPERLAVMEKVAIAGEDIHSHGGAL